MAAALYTPMPLSPPGLDQCTQPTFRHSNPGLCGDGSPFPPFPGGGGGADGGLIGALGRALHNLTGGLL